MRIKLGILFSWLFVLNLLPVVAQQTEPQRYYDAADRQIFQRYMRSVDRELSMPELMVQTAQFFLNTPYASATLEKEPEGLVVNLRAFDCTTFVETVLALARTAKDANPTFDTFCRQLQAIRFRDGQVNDYADRLHYMSDWIYDNSRKGYVRDMAANIGGRPIEINLSYMSTHPDSYPALKRHPELVERIAGQEQAVSARKHAYLPKDNLGVISLGIEGGDILCFLTSIEGLDVTHVGIAYWQDERLTYIHASSAEKKVVVQTSSLAAYLHAQRRCPGLLIARPR